MPVIGGHLLQQVAAFVFDMGRMSRVACSSHRSSFLTPFFQPRFHLLQIVAGAGSSSWFSDFADVNARQSFTRPRGDSVFADS